MNSAHWSAHKQHLYQGHAVFKTNLNKFDPGDKYSEGNIYHSLSLREIVFKPTCFAEYLLGTRIFRSEILAGDFILQAMIIYYSIIGLFENYELCIIKVSVNSTFTIYNIHTIIIYI